MPSAVRLREASSTTGRRVPSLAFRWSNWLSSRRSSRPARIVRRTASCAGGGSTSSASSPRGSASSFIRAMSESFCRSLASPISVRGPVIRLKTSGSSRLSKKLPARAEGSSRRTAGDDPGRDMVSGISATTGSQTPSSKTTTPSSTPHAPHGESSSLSPKRSRPSECANGRTSVSRYVLWYYSSRTRPVGQDHPP